MAENALKLPVKTTGKAGEKSVKADWLYPFETLRHEVDHLFDNFGTGLFHLPGRRQLFDFHPFWQTEMKSGAIPAVDIVEKEKAWEISVELPGMMPEDIDVSLANGMLTIRGEKKAGKEEKDKDYYLSERRYGVFERHFAMPEYVDIGHIEAMFKTGVLTVVLPKTPAALQAEKKITVKAA